MWRALRICKVLPRWQVQMHDVMPYFQCMLNLTIGVGEQSWKYAVCMTENISLLPCTKWFIHTQHWQKYYGIIFFFSGGILFCMISRRVIMMVCGKPWDFLPYPRHTLQQCLALLSTRWSGLFSFSFFFFSCDARKKSIKLKTKKH